jgi:hypothetical protein
MEAVYYEDLLDQHFDGYGQHDCVWLAKTINERAGHPIPAGAFPPGGYGCEEQGLRWANQILADAARTGATAKFWERVGDEPCHASRVGDVIYTLGRDGRHHFTTLVQDKAPAMVVTTSEKNGVQAFPLARMSSTGKVLGVYRLKKP